MINRKKIIPCLLFFFLALACWANAQQLYVEAGYGNAFFNDYVNDLGRNSLHNNLSKPTELSLEAGFKFKLVSDRIKWNLGVGHFSYKVNTAFSSGNITIPTFYDLSYLSLKTGMNLSVIRWHRLRLQIHSHLSHDWLTYGSNSYRDQFIDLSNGSDFDDTLWSYHKGFGVEFEISTQISSYLNYNTTSNFFEDGEDSREGEKYKLKRNAITFGLIFSIEKKTKIKDL